MKIVGLHLHRETEGQQPRRKNFLHFSRARKTPFSVHVVVSARKKNGRFSFRSKNRRLFRSRY